MFCQLRPVSYSSFPRPPTRKVTIMGEKLRCKVMFPPLSVPPLHLWEKSEYNSRAVSFRKNGYGPGCHSQFRP